MGESASEYKLVFLFTVGLGYIAYILLHNTRSYSKLPYTSVSAVQSDRPTLA